MFEEVPRVRRGFLGLPVRPFAAGPFMIGPFVIGGGMALVALGGSVAVAATVLTASTSASNKVVEDVPARRVAPPVVSSGTASAHRPVMAVGTVQSRPAGPVPVPSSPPRSVPGPAIGGLLTGTSGPASVPAASNRSTGSVGSPTAVTRTPQPTSPASSTGPLGNALVYIHGYDRVTGTLAFQYASRVAGTQQYRVIEEARFRAGLATGLTVVSAGSLCPPAGSSCSTAELVAGAADGFFAEAAIDPAGLFESIVELDDADPAAQPAPSDSPTG